MFPLFKKEVETYQSLFHKERKKAFEGLAFLTSIANEISNDALSCSDELELIAKLKMLKRFSHIFEEFNHDVELAVSQFDKRMIEVGKSSAAIVDSTHPLVGAPSRIPKADLSGYKIGHRGKCVISHIKSIEDDLCFIVDLNRSRSNNFRDHVIAPYDGLPDVGTVFAILIESKCFRAIRTHSESTLVSYKVTLIDIGETIALPLYRSEKFQLSQSAALMSPMAILCLVEKVDGEPENCLQRMFGNKRFNFEIKNICANMLQVELFTENENTEVAQMERLLCSMAVSSISQPPTPSLGRRDIQNISSGNFATSSVSQPTTPSLPRRINSRNSNPFRVEQVDHNKSVFDFSTSNFATSSPNQAEINDNQQSDWFSSKDHRIAIKSLPLPATEDTQMVQMKNRTDNLNNMSTPASRPEDQTRPCPLGAYPKNGPSFDHNGQNLNESFGFRGDSVDSPNGQNIAVIPTAIISSDNIYLQLSSNAAQLADFQTNLNRCVTLRRVTKTPSISETVLARYSGDELIYRAQVTQFIDRHSLMVLYVDYGNTERVTLDNVFEWDPFCDTIAFQAINCTLVDIKVKEGNEQTVKDFLINNILNKKMNAAVLSCVDNRLMVRLTDMNGNDIGEQILNRSLTL